jgi:hypothetical protein
MIDIIPSNQEDLPRLREWVAADPWHKHQKTPEWWLTGNGYLSFCIRDEDGPIFYSRIDQDQEWFRLHCQFGPRSEVNRGRVVAGITAYLKVIPSYLESNGKRMRFDSENSSLIKFLESRGFHSDPAGDFVFEFKEK